MSKAKRFVSPNQLSLLTLLPTPPLQMLTEFWGEANERYFGGKLRPVPIVGGHEKSSRLLGTYGLDTKTWKPRIMIRASLIGRFDEPGLYLQAADVVLHEMIHQYMAEAVRAVDENHGPRFTAKANEIGARLGLPPVTQRKPRGKPGKLSKHWPHCVRPERAYWLDNPRRVHLPHSVAMGIDPMPSMTVHVGWLGGFGNPFLPRDHGLDGAVRKYREWLDGDGPDEIDECRGLVTYSRPKVLDSIWYLCGKDLACGCPDGQPCHGDELLRRAAA